MLYSDREIRPREREFLLKLRSLSDRSPEMESLCDEALSARPTQWSGGGSYAIPPTLFPFVVH